MAQVHPKAEVGVQRDQNRAQRSNTGLASSILDTRNNPQQPFVNALTIVGFISSIGDRAIISSAFSNFE